ncbi:MAG: phosphoglucosamine mutase [Defluviitaleaceae bacterium]|nr:phosphoglucosamine mutase [Defluviitaleaceae bacterium]
MKRLFGTDGIRERANTKLTIQKATAVGQAGALVLTKGHTGNERPRIAIAWDPRLSSDMLVHAMTAGICSVGVDVIKFGVLPTSGLPVVMKLHGASAGVMVSASHNSFEDNGIKFMTASGHKLSDEIENEIEATINKLDEITLPWGAGVGRVLFYDRPQDDYVGFLKKCIKNIDLSGFKVALDCANGATFAVAPQVFTELGAKVLSIGDRPDGININHECGSTHMEQIVKFVKENDVNVAFAFDGDGDRCFAVDEAGNVVDGDQIMSVIAMQMKAEGKLAGDTVVSTIMVNMGFTIAAREHGFNLLQTKVGDRYVLEEMKKGGYMLGGEQSGHIILMEHQTTGDGILTALVIAEIMAKTGKTLSELNTVMTKLPQVIVNAKVANEAKQALMENPMVDAMVAEIETRLEGTGRVLVRPSGTEAVIRVMIEGKDEEEIAKEAQALARILETAGGKE